MDVKFIQTDSQNLASLPIVNGQIIALTDAPGLYYDMNDVRHNPAEAIFWSEIPKAQS